MWQNDQRRTHSPAEHVAIANLQYLVRISAERRIGPDIVVKAFADLDAVFFGGRLRGNVVVSWASDARATSLNEQRNLPPAHPWWGVAPFRYPGEDGQCRIEFCARVMFLPPATTACDLDPLKRMVETMLHEMCPAYETVRYHDQATQADTMSISGPRSVSCIDVLSVY